jgi:D-amino peptidase
MSTLRFPMLRRAAALSAAAAMLLALAHASAGSLAVAAELPQDGPRILIVADMEGLTGVVTGDQLGPGGFEYERFRRVMTDEVLAAMEGARAAGASEFLVADSHGNGQNLLIDMLPDDVRVIRSWPRPLGMLQGVDQEIDGVLFIGFHAGTTNPDGVRAHTMSSANLTDLMINDESVPEAVWGAAIAGHFGVPVLMLSGDEAIAAEATRFLPQLETAVVKRSLSFHSADTLTPAAGQKLIRETAERAVRRIAEIEPYVVPTPVRVTVRFKHYQPSQVLALLPIFERPDAHSISYEAADMVEASKIETFIGEYRIDIIP